MWLNFRIPRNSFPPHLHVSVEHNTFKNWPIREFCKQDISNVITECILQLYALYPCLIKDLHELVVPWFFSYLLNWRST